MKQETYPDTFNLDVNRPALTAYYRKIRQRAVIGPALIVSILVGLAVPAYLGLDEGAALLSGLLIALLFFGTSVCAIYSFFMHRQAKEDAEGLHVTVDGPYLRIREGGRRATDRKLHFRSIVDYATYSDPILRRFGLETLRLTIQGGCLDSTIDLPGLHRCLEVRDLLATIDATREIDHV